MVFERQSRQKGLGALSVPWNASSSSSSSTAEGALAKQKPEQEQQQQQQAPAEARHNKNKGLVTASLGLRSLLGSARASSIFLDNDSLILPSENDMDNNDDYDHHHHNMHMDMDNDSCMSSSLNLSLQTAGGGGAGGGGMYTSNASVGGGTVSSVLTVANTVTEDPSLSFGAAVSAPATSPATAPVVPHAHAAPADELQQDGRRQKGVMKTHSNRTSLFSPFTSKGGNAADDAETPFASGSRPLALPTTNNTHTTLTTGTRANSTTTTYMASSPEPNPTSMTAGGTNANANDDLKIVATASMITIDSDTSPTASAATPRNNTISTSLMARPPPSPSSSSSSSSHESDDDSHQIMAMGSSKRGGTFCRYGPRWLKFLLLVSVVFLLASIALVAVGLSIQYVDVGQRSDNSSSSSSSSSTSSATNTPPGQAEADRSGAQDGHNNNHNNGDSFGTFATPTTAPLSSKNQEESSSSSATSNNSTEAVSTPSQALNNTSSSSAMPTQAPTPGPTLSPSSVPTNLPSLYPTTLFPSSSGPTSNPTTTLRPSSMLPALAAPEILRPTETPATGTSSPSQAQSSSRPALEDSDTVTFYVLAGQWETDQSETTQRGADWLLQNLPSSLQDSSAFLVHLGDWNGPAGAQADEEYEQTTADGDGLSSTTTLDCSEQAFVDVHSQFSTSSVPVYFTVGNREYGDCPDPEAALENWRTSLQDYDLQYWNHPQWDVWNDRSSGYDENWIFSHNDVVFSAINLARGNSGSSRDTTTTSLMDDTEWERRYEATLDWININYYDSRRFNQVFCILTSSGPEDTTNEGFWDELLSRIENRYTRMHFVIVHRNLPGETFEYNRRYDGIRNLDVVSVQASVWPPMRIQIDLQEEDDNADVSVDQSTWFDEFVESSL